LARRSAYRGRRYRRLSAARADWMSARWPPSPDALEVSLAEVLGVERGGSLTLAARVMAAPQADDTLPSRRRLRQLLGAEAWRTTSSAIRGSS